MPQPAERVPLRPAAGRRDGPGEVRPDGARGLPDLRGPHPLLRRRSGGPPRVVSARPTRPVAVAAGPADAAVASADKVTAHWDARCASSAGHLPCRAWGKMRLPCGAEKVCSARVPTPAQCASELSQSSSTVEEGDITTKRREQKAKEKDDTKFRPKFRLEATTRFEWESLIATWCAWMGATHVLQSLDRCCEAKCGRRAQTQDERVAGSAGQLGGN